MPRELPRDIAYVPSPSDRAEVALCESLKTMQDAFTLSCKLQGLSVERLIAYGDATDKIGARIERLRAQKLGA